MEKIVFLDRDGTINEEVNYLHRTEDLKFLPGVPEALRLLKEAGFKLVVVTNQVFSDGIEYDRGTMEYLQVLGEINRQIAQMADQVYEVIHGIPLALKGPDGEKEGAGL